jgi:uncharacterized repeat protein (TIGR01451 family)
MKRLWMRLGIVAGILAMGGGGVFVAQRGDTEEQSSSKLVVAEAPPPDRAPQPIPFSSQTGSPPSEIQRPSLGGSNEEVAAEGARYSDVPVVQPAAQYHDDGQASPAQLSISDEERYLPPTPVSSYAPPDSYVDEAPAAPYASRYGDAAAGSPAAPREIDGTAGAYDPEPSRYLAPPSSGEYASDVPATPIDPEMTDSLSSGEYQEPAAAAWRDDEVAAADGGTLRPPALATEPPVSSYGGGAPAGDPLAEPAGMPRISESPTNFGNPPLAPPPVASVAAGSAQLASATPGQRQLEGAQTPTLRVEKKGPSEVSVGQAATFEIIVRNVGEVVAHGVVVTDRIPQGADLADASPQFSQSNDGALLWQLGDLEPGDAATISMDIVPLIEGEIGSVAQVSFQTQASIRTVSTKPELVVKHTGPDKVLIGEEVVFEISVSNPGTGVATGIVLEEDVPEGLAHVGGRQLEYEVGTLRPGEEKPLLLVLKADKAGVVQNVLRVHADGGLETTDQATLEVTAPELQVAIGGAKRRYLEREVTYQIAVANPGTATAYDVQLVTFLPKGMKFVSADNKGNYDARQHAVLWSLAELKSQDSGSVKLTALPIETGEWKLRVEGAAELDLRAEYEHTTTVEALTELAFTVQDVQDPIEVGRETTYEIRVINNGKKAATNIQVAAAMPAELTPLKGDGPTRVAVEGQTVMMAPIDRLGPGDEAVYRIAAQGLRAGDHVIAVQLVSDEVPKPVTKQESTKVYADE